jgi:uncharacterized protein
MASAMFELVIFSLPSFVWIRRLRRSGWSRQESLRAAGLRWGTLGGYAVALALAIPVAAIAFVLLDVIQTHVLHGGSKNITGAPTSAGDYLAVIVLAVAEEMLFRGFVAGVLFRRLGPRRGNVYQALIFLAPHTLLLLISTSLWPLLPLQFIAGLVLGWLRERSGSIGPSSLLHTLTNLLPAVLFGL